ncbi:MAG: phosphate acetyltransferase [Legionella sp.]|nr:phosphate acetyltransferase [Legionella sp.]
MRKKIYLTGIEKNSGKTFVSLGIVTILKEQYPALDCFKLFSELDNSQVKLLATLTNSSISPLMEISPAIAMMRDQPEDLFGRVLESTETKNANNLTYFEGTDFESDNGVFEYEFNLTMAYQLNCDVILVVSAKDRTLEHTFSVITTALDIGKKNHARIVTVIINRVASSDEQEAQRLFEDRLTNVSVIIVPEFDYLANPSVNDIATKLAARVICGEKELNRTVKQLTIAAKTVGNFLESRIDRKGMLIITPADRVDILLGSLLADQSANYPKIAGIVLTGEDMPGATILEIIAGLEHPFPVLLSPKKTYETATTLFSATYPLSVNDMEKVKAAITAMTPYISVSLLKLITTKQEISRLSPAIFLYDLQNKAQQAKRHIVLPEGHDPRILAAADYLLKRNIVRITLLGVTEKIRFLARRLQLDLPNVQIIEIDKSSKKGIYAKKYFKLREHKNVNLPIAMERMNDVNYFAAMMVYCGDADGMVSGAEHTTADTVRPALEIIKTKPGVAKVSSIFIMCMSTRVLIYGDCAINPEPDSETLAEITLQATEIAKRLGIEPRVALLSYSSGESGKGKSVDKVAKAMAIIRATHPDLLAEGPIQYDAAVDPEVASKKMPHSKLAGDANVLIFPDLNTGNNTYKAVQRESGALAIGPVLLGLNKPVNDLSRGCTPQDIINTILVTAIQAGESYAHIDP